MTAAQLGVGGHGQVPLGARGLVPVGTVGHDRGEGSLALPVGLLQGLVAGGQRMLGRSLVVVAEVFSGAIPLITSVRALVADVLPATFFAVTTPSSMSPM